MLTIGTIGEVSTGKSSFINSIIGLPIASASLKRETFKPTRYILTNSLPFDINVISSILSETPTELTGTLVEKRVPNAFSGFPEIAIIDFPGLNDKLDEKNEYFDIFRTHVEKCNYIIYITTPEKALLQSESSLYRKIKEVVDRVTTHVVKLLCLINKYDNENDSELETIYRDMCVDEPKFRYSAHIRLFDKLVKNKVRLLIPEIYRNEFNKVLRNNGVSVMIKENEIFDGSRYTPTGSKGDLDGFISHIYSDLKGYSYANLKHVLEKPLDEDPVKLREFVEAARLIFSNSIYHDTVIEPLRRDSSITSVIIGTDLQELLKNVFMDGKTEDLIDNYFVAEEYECTDNARVKELKNMLKCNREPLANLIPQETIETLNACNNDSELILYIHQNELLLNCLNVTLHQKRKDEQQKINVVVKNNELKIQLLQSTLNFDKLEKKDIQFITRQTRTLFAAFIDAFKYNLDFEDFETLANQVLNRSFTVFAVQRFEVETVTVHLDRQNLIKYIPENRVFMHGVYFLFALTCSGFSFHQAKAYDIIKNKTKVMREWVLENYLLLLSDRDMFDLDIQCIFDPSLTDHVLDGSITLN